MEKLTPDINEIEITEITNIQIIFAYALQLYCLTRKLPINASLIGEKYPDPLRRFENRTIFPWKILVCTTSDVDTL